MKCMKCGCNTEEQVFCPDCLENMAKAPVRPGTPVVIFERSNRKRKNRTPKVEPEEIIFKLNKTVRRLKIWVAVFAGLFVLSAAAAGYLFFTSEDGPPIGQNFNTVVESSDPTE